MYCGRLGASGRLSISCQMTEGDKHSGAQRAWALACGQTLPSHDTSRATGEGEQRRMKGESALQKLKSGKVCERSAHRG